MSTLSQSEKSSDAEQPGSEQTPALYGVDDLAGIPWPDTEDGAYARAYLTPLMRDGTQTYMANVKTEMRVLMVDGQALPISINSAEYESSYVCSPYNHYVSYAKVELTNVPSGALRGLLGGLLSGLGLLLKLGEINRNIHVNNWLLSTNLYPPLTDAQIERITRFLASRFPRHAIVFRSINAFEDDTLLRAFVRQRFTMVASRQVYIQHPTELDEAFYNANSRKIWKKDMRLLKDGTYEMLGPDDIAPDDLPRIVELYNLLYLEKYSMHNPQFSVSFLRLALDSGILHLRALKREGRIDGAIGFFCRDGVMTTPLFGYDTALPPQTGLYRMLSAWTMVEGQNLGLILNQSSGAASFKRSRGGKGAIEYSAVFEAHLNPLRRLTWRFLATLINRIAIPLLTAYKL